MNLCVGFRRPLIRSENELYRGCGGLCRVGSLGIQSLFRMGTIWGASSILVQSQLPLVLGLVRRWWLYWVISNLLYKERQ